MSYDTDKDLPNRTPNTDRIGVLRENGIPKIEHRDDPPDQMRQDSEYESYEDQPESSYALGQRDDFSLATTNAIAPTNIGFFEMPVRNFLNGKNYHMHLVNAEIRHKALVKEFGSQIIRSVTAECNYAKGESIESLILRLDESSILWVGDKWLRFYTKSIEQSKIWRRKLRRFWKKTAPVKPRFSLIAIGGPHGVAEEQVEVTLKARMTSRKLALHYGAEFMASFHREGMQFLKQESLSGVLVLRGEPGGGKTSLIRHWMVELHRTHVFYVVPPDQFTHVTAHHLIEFQRNAGRMHSGKILVLVIEDGEALVLPRAADNYCQVSNLLNLVSGFLADYLTPKIIITLNTDLDRIDPALLRPGRLRGQWEFTRLDPDRSALLAASLRKVLPEKRAYTLAEIYNAPAAGNVRTSRRAIGFQNRA
ncbi:ATPase family associated with various cellular activities (AAA) [Lacunisphaera limnophila]|uniref:ATPase family associated with various cellular activities (AAA) n=1 Tax=Lacunisphaera limnophila TaxID=1838286 RepID=A0A1D8AYZ6_9BACT|nr:AAA family ATPase [Lacunisphaera limnophila]AOS46118.1 ATPase family associated with various cellular activities (AAA) [Lacunisphaera limnophila]